MGCGISRKILGALGLSIAVGLIEAFIVTSTLSTIVTMIHPERLPPQLATQFVTLIRLDAQTLFIIIFIIGWIGAFVEFLAIIVLLLILGFD
jgi:uncharacterized membrane protein required for colicin V production